MTEMSKSKKEWKGETVLINKEMLSRHLAVLQEPIYYVAGPPSMVAAMREALVSAGVEERDDRLDARTLARLARSIRSCWRRRNIEVRKHNRI
jgi:NAD(P)H-flavin reductase